MVCLLGLAGTCFQGGLTNLSDTDGSRNGCDTCAEGGTRLSKGGACNIIFYLLNSYTYSFSGACRLKPINTLESMVKT